MITCGYAHSRHQTKPQPPVQHPTPTPAPAPAHSTSHRHHWYRPHKRPLSPPPSPNIPITTREGYTFRLGNRSRRPQNVGLSLRLRRVRGLGGYWYSRGMGGVWPAVARCMRLRMRRAVVRVSFILLISVKMNEQERVKR